MHHFETLCIGALLKIANGLLVKTDWLYGSAASGYRNEDDDNGNRWPASDSGVLGSHCLSSVFFCYASVDPAAVAAITLLSSWGNVTQTAKDCGGAGKVETGRRQEDA